MNNGRPSPEQVDAMMNALKMWSGMHKFDDSDDLNWECLSNITDLQRRYFWSLMYNGKHFKLSQFLANIGFRHKK